MKVTKEAVEAFIIDGAASAMKAAKEDAAKIAAQINAEVETNSSHTSSNTLKLGVLIKVDGDNGKVEIEGGYSFKTPDLNNKAPKVIRQLDDPNQPVLCGDCGMADCQLCTKDPETIETGGKTSDDE